MATSEVQILEICQVAPSPTSPAGSSPPTSLALTFFDILWLNFPPTQRIFFYEFPRLTTSTFSDVILPQLKRSLSLTLAHFLPLAGTLTWPPVSDGPLLSIRGGGRAAAVSVTVAESDADFRRLSGSGFRQAEESQPLVPKLHVTDTEAAALAVQITAFPDCGFSIGISCHHAVMDGKSSTMFLKAWAWISSLGSDGSNLPPDLIPLFDRTVIDDSNGILAAIVEKRLKMREAPENRSLKLYDLETGSRNGSIRLRGTFVLSRADVEKLRRKHSKPEGNRLSAFAIACAYSWVCMAKAGEWTDETLRFMSAADGRARMKPPVPANYFGNCLGGFLASCPLSVATGEDGVAAAAGAISEGIKVLNERGVVLDRDMLAGFALVRPDPSRKAVSVAGSPQFGVYGVDFGWGRPRRVEIVSIDETAALDLSESGDGGGGVEIGLVLDQAKMEAFASAFSKGLEALI